MKDTICLIAGIVGGFIATLLGGWDSALATLVVFMGIDFVTGIVTAAMGKSKHSESGTLNSTAGWVGLAKKFCILLMVVVGVRIDILIGTNYIRDAVCISFCLNELLSIIESNRQPDQRAKKMSRDQPRLKSRIRFITMNCSE